MVIRNSLSGICLVVAVSFAAAKPLALKGLFYIPAPPGNRPACAEKTLTFCENVDNYPSKLIEELIKLGKHDINFLIDETEGLEEPPEYVLTSDLPTDRSRKIRSFADAKSDAENLSRICTVPSRMATPKIASNSKGEWRFIAQEDSSKIHQAVEVHICSENVECQKSCTQFYTPVSMKSLTSNGKLIQDIFWFPSSCQCTNSSENEF